MPTGEPEEMDLQDKRAAEQKRTGKDPTLPREGQMGMFGNTFPLGKFGATDIAVEREREAHNRRLGQNSADLAKYGEIRINAQSDVVPNIMTQGFRTQHHPEITDSGGTYDPELRRSYEDKVFGEGARPTYGWMKGPSESENRTLGYGNVSFTLNRGQFGEDTTVTRGDSLMSDLVPQPANRPSEEVNDWYDNNWDYDDGGDIWRAESPSYHEAQIHTPVSVSGVDRAEIDVNTSHYQKHSREAVGNTEVRGAREIADRRAYDALTKAGIPTKLVKESIERQYMLPFSQGEYAKLGMRLTTDPADTDAGEWKPMSWDRPAVTRREVSKEEMGW